MTLTNQINAAIIQWNHLENIAFSHKHLTNAYSRHAASCRAQWVEVKRLILSGTALDLRGVTFKDTLNQALYEVGLISR